MAGDRVAAIAALPPCSLGCILHRPEGHWALIGGTVAAAAVQSEVRHVAKLLKVCCRVCTQHSTTCTVQCLLLVGVTVAVVLVVGTGKLVP